MPFPRALPQSETQTTESRIWTPIDKTIFYQNKHHVSSDIVRACICYGLIYQINTRLTQNYMYVSNQPSPLRSGCDTRHIFKRSKAALNSIFLFRDWFPLPRQQKNPVFPTIHPLPGKIDRSMPFLRTLVRIETQSHLGFELRSTIPFPTTITVMLSASPQSYMHIVSI